MPKVFSRSCANCATLGVSLPRSTSTTWPRPKCDPPGSRVRSTALSSFCAGMVPSNSFGGSRQMSQAPQFSGSPVLAEAAQQDAAAAGGGLGDGDHGLQPGPLDPLLLGHRRAFLDAVAGQRDIPGAIQQQGARRQPVAAGAADFLVPALGRLRQVEVADPAHVRPVDAHAEGDGRRHDDGIAPGEAAVRVPLGIGRHAGVEAQRVMPIGAQPFGGLLGLGPGAAVDDAGPRPIPRRLDEGAELRPFLLARGGADQDVRPVEAAAEHRAVGEAELGADILDGARVGGRGQRQPRHVGEAFGQHAEAAVFRPEVVPPLADAMRLVDGEERDRRVRPAGPAYCRRRAARARCRAA